MGSVLRRADSSLHFLAASTSIGRATDATIRLDRPEISRDHLSLRWGLQGWAIHAVSTTSGSWLNGRPLRLSERVILQEGDEIALGRPGCDLVVQSVEPPQLIARNRLSGEQRSADAAGLLVLPEGRVEQRPGLGWGLEDPTGFHKLDLSRGVGSNLSFNLQIGEWELYLPPPDPPTISTSPGLDQLQVILRHPRDMEQVRLILRSDAWEANMGYRAEFYPLLVLAWERLNSGDGWMETDDLTRKVRTYDWRTVEIYLGRVGTLVERVGVSDGKQIIESRRKKRRIGIPPERIQVQEES